MYIKKIKHNILSHEPIFKGPIRDPLVEVSIVMCITEQLCVHKNICPFIICSFQNFTEPLHRVSPGHLGHVDSPSSQVPFYSPLPNWQGIRQVAN